MIYNMNNDEYHNIYPNIKKTFNIVKFKYHIIEIKLFEFVRIAVYLYNENDMLIDAKGYIIEGEEYNAWSNDDKYILNLIKQKIQDGI
jgi:hypothetical protein